MNNNTKYLLWLMLTYLHPDEFHVYRLPNYHKHEKKFDFKGITNYPMKVKDVYKFENKYNVKIRLLETNKNNFYSSHSKNID